MKYTDLRDSRKKERTTPEGVVFHNWEEGNRLNEVAVFKSMRHLVEGMNEKKDYLSSDYKGYWYDDDEWRFGSEYQDMDATSEALKNSIPTDNTINMLNDMRKELSTNEKVLKLMRKADSFKRKRIFKETGDELCIDRVLCGDPLHWQSTTKRGSTDVVQIHVSYTLSCGNSEEEFQKIACLATIACELLQKAGKNVEIVALGTARGLLEGGDVGSRAGIMFPLKRADEPLDVSKIACIGVSGLFRAYTFAAWEGTLEADRLTRGLGRSEEFTKSEREALGVKHMIHQSWTKDAGQQVCFLEEVFNNLNETKS